VPFFIDFSGGVWERLLCHFNGNGCHLGAFWATFGHILKVCGVLLDVTHSQVETYIFRFGSSQAGTSSSTFPGLDSGCVFKRFYMFFCDFRNHLGTLWAPFGPPFLGELAISLRIGEEVASGVPKEALLSAFSNNLGVFRMTF